MKNNRRGYGLFGFTILFIFLIIMWALVLGRMWNLAGSEAEASGATGIDGFLWGNLNLIFGIILVIVAATYFKFGGNNG